MQINNTSTCAESDLVELDSRVLPAENDARETSDEFVAASDIYGGCVSLPMICLDEAVFVAGEIYAFSRGPEHDDVLLGIFDRMVDGRVMLEVASAVPDDGGLVRYDLMLPDEFCYVRHAVSGEIRDFCFNYGFDCGSRCASTGKTLGK